MPSPPAPASSDSVHLLSYELRPSDDNSEREGIGGAFVSCWVRSQSIEDARRRAGQHLRDSGWVILDTVKELTVNPQQCPAESYPYLRQAQAEGEVFVIHAFPPQPADA